MAFPIQILGQIIEQIDNGFLFEGNDDFETKLGRVSNFVESSFLEYPKESQRKFEILYLSRIDSHFYASKISWSPIVKWKCENITIPEKSGLIDEIGSGAESLKNW